ncbi:protein FAM43A [Tetranychus urticae]|uniref:PID domain-containing protein n=1 Tax=Tetranychus urticae TaxID=32264 RepID=T1L4B4_TETUR|nr:protein FAM43A [Tetranychus urticae]
MWLRKKVKTATTKKEKVVVEEEEEKRRSSLCSKLKKMVLKSSEKSFGLNTVQFKFWSTRKSLTITDYDPVYKVVYLGNVLTLLAKGDGAIDKALPTLWKNYCSNVKHDIYMKLTICASGLKAITREHGLTEYWSNRITYAATHPDHPKIFCWIYRHVGRKMKQELRCHAVLCSKESKAKEMAEFLNKRLITALQEFRREKKYRQNFRLSLASSCQEIPLIPLRKQLLIKGLANFRQPLERSKSAPKLTSIEEILEESEEEDDVEDDETEEETEEDTASDTTINILRMIF